MEATQSTFRAPVRGSSQAYADYVSGHEMPMLRAQCSAHERGKITKMKLSHDGEWVTVYFRASCDTQKLLGTSQYKFSEGPSGVAIARADFDRRFPHLIDKYIVCHE